MTIKRMKTHLTQSNFVPFFSKESKLKDFKIVPRQKFKKSTTLTLNIQSSSTSDLIDTSIFYEIPSSAIFKNLSTPILSEDEWQKWNEQVAPFINLDNIQEPKIYYSPLQSPMLPDLFNFFRVDDPIGATGIQELDDAFNNTFMM